MRALADGGFYECRSVIVPYSKHEIWPRDLSDRPSEIELKRANDKLSYNHSLILGLELSMCLVVRVWEGGLLSKIGPSYRTLFCTILLHVVR